jgi:predicted dehydrogenase
MKALEQGLHVLCEKPLAMNLAEAREMAQLAQQKGVKHMVPFTYSFMPTTRFLEQLVQEGYIGKPYHLNMRYYAGYARGGEYAWRFDTSEAGSGVVGDLGPHWLYLARMFFGEIKAVTCLLGRNVERAERPDGKAYERGDDSAMLLLEFESGAQGNIHVSAVSYEGTPFGQTHHIELHGSEGTLYSYTDWDKTQEVRGARANEGMPKPLEIPADIWGQARRDTVHNTYRDIFRLEDNMTRGFITAILEDKPVRPNFFDGVRIQQMTDAAIKSAREGRRVEIGTAVI